MNRSKNVVDLEKAYFEVRRVGMNQRKLDDLDFYEKYLLNAGQAERDKYIEEHPDFLNDYPVSYEHRELLQDELYRKLLRRIRAYETGEKAEKKE